MPPLPPLTTITFALTTLHAGYLSQLSFRQPSSRKITSSTETWPMYLAASPFTTTLARTIILATSTYHAILTLTLALPDTRATQRVCPNTTHLDTVLFTWSPRTLASLTLLYASSALRLAAYAQLGADFTYRIAAPSTLVTTGLYAYVRHPSYTGLLGVMIAVRALFFGKGGTVGCTVPVWGEDSVCAVTTVVGFAVSVWLFMVRRVREEEAMMEGEFGVQWREWKGRTMRFVPFVL